MYLERGIHPRLSAALQSTPVVVLEGARGVGKTQLAKHLVDRGQLQHFVTLADETTLAAATESPKTFAGELSFGSVIDEAQLEPRLQLAIKALVDEDTRPGRLLLTGSSRLAQESLGGSAPLAGRSLTLRLEPFTQSERSGRPLSIIETLVDGDPSDLEFVPEPQSSVVDRAIRGGFLRLASDEQRTSFLDDVLPAAEVGRRERSGVISVGRHLAQQTARMFVANTAAKDLGLDSRTVTGHVELWERLMLARRLANWRPTHGGSDRATPKILLTDAGLARAWGELDSSVAKGQLIETLVANELIAQGWATPGATFLHYREDNRHEVDLVLRTARGDLIGVEVKSAAEVRSRDFAQLRNFRERTTKRLTRGYVFYTGDTVQPFGDDLWAIPIPALWGTHRAAQVSSALEKSVDGLASRLRRTGSPSASTSRLPRLEAVLEQGTEVLVAALDGELSSIDLAVYPGVPPSDLERDRDQLAAISISTVRRHSSSPPIRVPELTHASDGAPTAHRSLSIEGLGHAVIAQGNVTALPHERVRFSVAAGRADLDPSIGFGSLRDVRLIEFDSSDSDFSADSVESAFAELMPHIAELLGQL